jgi:tetratricopeptide (TPR) repeat protein
MPSVRDAHFRHAKHFLDVIWEATKLCEQGGEEFHRGSASFDRELDNIKLGQLWASSNAAKDIEADTLCSNFPDAGGYLVDLRLHPQERIAWQESGLSSARRLNDRNAERTHLNNLGLTHFVLGQPLLAAESHQAAMSIHRDLEDLRGQACSLNNLGMCHAATGSPREAVTLFSQSLELCRDIGDLNGQWSALNNLGLAYADLGDHRTAIESHKQGITIARQRGDFRRAATALGNLGLS